MIYVKKIRKKHLTSWWSNEPSRLYLDDEVWEFPEKFCTAILVVKKEGSEPLKFGRIFGSPISDEKFAVGFRDCPSGAWNLWVKLDGMDAMYFENYRKCEVNGKVRVCLFAISDDGMQHLIYAENLNGSAMVLHARWSKTDIEQPLFFASTYMKRIGLNLDQLIRSTPLNLDEEDA